MTGRKRTDIEKRRQLSVTEVFPARRSMKQTGIVKIIFGNNTRDLIRGL